MKIITTHLHADFDCLASMVAAKKLYPEAELVFPGAQEKPVRDFLDRGGFPISFRRLKGLPLDETRLMVVVDASTRERIGVFAPLADRAEVETHIYDHHPAGRIDVPHKLAVIRERGATVTIFTEIFRERGITVTPQEATLMTLGLYEDTGRLTYSSVRKEDFLAAAWLLEMGADLDIVKTNLTQELTAEQVDLLNSLLKSLEYHKAGAASVAIAHAHARRYVGDLSALAHRIMDIESPAALFALVYMGDRIHLIARSRVEGVDAGAVAQALGGGGHPTAASATIKGVPMPQLIGQLKTAIESATQANALTAELMTEKAVTAGVDDAVAQAETQMTRFDIGGMPVIRDGKVAGLITRQIVQKAIHHGMGDKPVSEFMTTEFLSVHPDTPLSSLEEIIIEKRQKMAPVVDRQTGALIGIVTRGMVMGKLYGDSLKLRGRADGGAPRRDPLTKNVSSLMKELLHPAQNLILQAAAGAGDELGFPVYAAGGFARDLLLRSPPADMDIVTEGDGVALAVEMARRLGGRAHAHQKFKTAVVLLPDGGKVDVATARIEYYPHPAALPVVERGAIRNDLYRRDFSVNAMAVRLNGPSPGMLIDYFGGQTDLKNHAIRVLHNLSFVEDPTRAFRAVRFERRLGFTIGRQTLALLENAARHGLFNRLSGERTISEIVMILRERRPFAAVARMKELGLLKFVHPGIRFDPPVERLMERLEDVITWWELSFPSRPLKRWAPFLMALMDTLDDEGAREMGRMYQSSKHIVDLAARRLEQARRAARALLPGMGGGTRLSEAQKALGDMPAEALLYLAAKSPGPGAGELVTRYITQARGMAPFVNGDDLIGMGISPSRQVGEILARVHSAQLDGEVTSREEALALARELAGQ
jgi:tRNA nucleotidyltransferase (CCA-adding enzyme)